MVIIMKNAFLRNSPRSPWSGKKGSVGTGWEGRRCERIGVVTIKAKRKVEGKYQVARESVERIPASFVSAYQGGAVMTEEVTDPS